MICERCGWPMVTRQIGTGLLVGTTAIHEVSKYEPLYYFLSTCTNNRKHRVVIDMEEHNAVTA